MTTSAAPQLTHLGTWLHEPFLARASDPSAPDEGRHALGAFLTLRLVDRFRPNGDRPHPMALAYQVKATRDFLLDLHPQTPEVTHLLEVVRLAAAAQPGGRRSLLWPPLLAYAYSLEQELRLEEALDTVDTALGLDDGSARTEQIAALLQRARILRQMGRLEEARGSYSTARTQAQAVGDEHSQLLSRIGNARIARQLGNLSGSEKALREILSDAETAGDVDAQARAHHDLGAVLVHREQTRGALPHLYRAFELYDQQNGRMRALSDVGEALKHQGQYAAAKDAFEVVLDSAKSADVRATTMVALLELSVLTRNRMAFARWAREIGALGNEHPPVRQADLDLQLGLGHAVFGHREKAKRHLESAAARAEQHELNEILFQAESALDAVSKTSAQAGPDVQGPSRAELEHDLAEIVDKVHALREG